MASLISAVVELARADLAVDIASFIIVVIVSDELARLVVAEVAALGSGLPRWRFHPLAREVGLCMRNRVEVGAAAQVEALLMLIKHADHLRIIVTRQMAFGELLVLSGAAICRQALLRWLPRHFRNPSPSDNRALFFGVPVVLQLRLGRCNMGARGRLFSVACVCRPEIILPLSIRRLPLLHIFVLKGHSSQRRKLLEKLLEI